MYSTYRLRADELSDDFIKALKKVYQHRQIEIIVQEVQDDTEYLLSNQANKDHLLESVNDIRTQRGLIEVKLDDL